MSDVDKETEQKINQLQMFEQSLQGFLSQKQQFQTQLLEIESALKELEGAKEAYKIVGTIMVKGEAKTLTADLEQKKEMLNIRIKSLDKQETQIKEKASKLQEQVLSEIKK